MMMKNPDTKVVINTDISNYTLLKLRRSQAKIERKLQKEIILLTKELAEIKTDINKTLNRLEWKYVHRHPPESLKKTYQQQSLTSWPSLHSH